MELKVKRRFWALADAAQAANTVAMDDTRFDCLHGALFRAKVASIAALVQPDSHPTPAAPRREKAGKGVFTFHVRVAARGCWILAKMGCKG